MSKVAFVIVTAILLSSCASIVSSSSTVLGVDTTPQGAQVEIINRQGKTVYRGRTPVTTRVKNAAGFFKKASYQIKLTMDGYQPKLVTVDAHLNGWYFGNLLIGGVIGMLIVDPATGAMYKINDKFVDEKMLPFNSTGAVQQGEPQSLQILSLKDVPADLRGQLVRLPR